MDEDALTSLAIGQSFAITSPSIPLVNALTAMLACVTLQPLQTIAIYTYFIIIVYHSPDTPGSPDCVYTAMGFYLGQRRAADYYRGQPTAGMGTIPVSLLTFTVVVTALPTASHLHSPLDLENPGPADITTKLVALMWQRNPLVITQEDCR